jgi:peptide/nickel transport system ATP-binding protein
MLKLENITVRFGSPENSPVVNDVSLLVKPLDKIGIVGETGSGKSVLLLAMLKMLPPNALVSGRLLLDDQDLLQMSKKEITRIRGKRISYVPQGTGDGLNPLLTIGYQVGEPLTQHTKLKAKEVQSRVIEALKNFDMGDEEKIVKAYPHTLSGGMKQRAMIAMGVITGSPIIFVDEPTKGLDGRRVNMVVESFKLLADRTILCVTHDLRFARKIAEKIFVMYASQQVELASKEDFFREPLHPYSQALLQALPENGLHVNMGFSIPNTEYELSNACLFANRCTRKTNRCKQRPPMVDVRGRKVRCWIYVD